MHYWQRLARPALEDKDRNPALGGRTLQWRAASATSLPEGAGVCSVGASLYGAKQPDCSRIVVHPLPTGFHFSMKTDRIERKNCSGEC